MRQDGVALVQRMERLRASGIVGQLVRFAIVGGLSAVIYSAVYLPLATWALPPRRAWLAVFPAFAVAVAFGFVFHSRWSFKGHGTRDEGPGQQVKFVTVQASGMVLNAVFTWVITGWLGGPVWLPLVPAVTVTPLVTYVINRQWVFG